MRRKFPATVKRGVYRFYRAGVRTRRAAAGLARRVRVIPARLLTWRRGPAVREAARGPATGVDRYWARHLVRSEMFASARESEEYLEWRFREYPRYRELMGLWGDHDDEVVLDYGCGPGNDTVGFLRYSGARRVIGVDVSSAALELARKRIALHRFDRNRVDLVRISDGVPEIPLPDASVDFVHCSGVLHHTSAPKTILREFHRVLRPAGQGSLMVYNRRSLWFHLYVAYVLMAIGGEVGPIEEVFRRSTDGPDCPVSIAYDPPDFVSRLERGGFAAAFVGGYLSRTELELLERFGDAARRNERLGAEHRQFLDRVQPGPDGLPQLDGLYAGIGGVYRIRSL